MGQSEILIPGIKEFFHHSHKTEATCALGFETKNLNSGVF